MQDSRGFILLYRSILEHPVICKDSDYVAVWVHLLLTATHVDYEIDHKKERKTIKRGQLIASRKSIAEKYNIQESKVERILKRFETEHQIEQQGFNKYRIITLLNYDTYQAREQQNKQRVNNKRTTSEQQVNTYKEHKELNQQEEPKKEKPLNPKDQQHQEKIDEILSTYGDDLKRTVEDYEQHRKDIKQKMTLNAKKLMLMELEKLATDDMTKIAIIEQSIMNNWKGVFPLKNDKANYNTKPQDIKEWQRHQKGGPGHYI